jgi:hypothetical protein
VKNHSTVFHKLQAIPGGMFFRLQGFRSLGGLGCRFGKEAIAMEADREGHEVSWVKLISMICKQL